MNSNATTIENKAQKKIIWSAKAKAAAAAAAAVAAAVAAAEAAAAEAAAAEVEAEAAATEVEAAEEEEVVIIVEDINGKKDATVTKSNSLEGRLKTDDVALNKFIKDNSKYFLTITLDFANDYLRQIQTDTKSMSVDTQVKDQVMYVVSRFIAMMTILPNEPPPDDIIAYVKSKLTNPIDLRLYSYVSGVTRGIKYNLSGEKVEEDMMLLLMTIVIDEDLLQYTTTTIILFLKRLAEAMANTCWRTIKRINSTEINSIMRNMDTVGINHSIFTDIYVFADARKNASKTAA